MINDNEAQQIEDSKTDPQCFEPLYIKYYEQILKFVYKRMEDLDDARELTAIIFTKALINISKYKDQGFPFSSWLYRIAINEINQFYRDANKIRIVSIDDKGLQHISEETESQKEELISSLRKALLYLSADDLMLLELRYFENRAFAEVGEILNITEVNAKVKTYRILDKLKSIYAKVS